MRFMQFEDDKGRGLAVLAAGDQWRGFRADEAGFPGFLEDLLSAGEGALVRASRELSDGAVIAIDDVAVLPPLSRPGKIICAGLNYAEHTAEADLEQPDAPTLFPRFASTLIGHGDGIVRPLVSEQVDFEGELVAIIGRGGRHIPAQDALDHVAGWSIFNEVSIRDYQFKGAQWTLGKNFDGTGAFGPFFVTADELPKGASGLKLQTRLNGEIVQSASTAEMIHDTAALIAIISQAITLEPGDLVVTGTPAGVGAVRKPPLWMKAGDTVDVEIEGIGILTNPVVMEKAPSGVLSNAA